MLITLDDKKKAAEASAFRACMRRNAKVGSGMDQRTLNALAGFMDEVTRQRQVPPVTSSRACTPN